MITDKLRRSYSSADDLGPHGQSNSSLGLLLTILTALTAAVYHECRFSQDGLASSPGLLESDDVTTQILVKAEDLQRPHNTVRFIHRHRPHVMGNYGDLPLTGTCAGFDHPLAFPSAFRASLPSLLYCLTFPFFLQFFYSSHSQKSFFPCPRSRLEFRSRETGSAVLPRFGPSILLAWAESGAYSQDSLYLPAFRDGAVSAFC